MTLQEIKLRLKTDIGYALNAAFLLAKQERFLQTENRAFQHIINKYDDEGKISLSEKNFILERTPKYASLLQKDHGNELPMIITVPIVPAVPQPQYLAYRKDDKIHIKMAYDLDWIKKIHTIGSAYFDKKVKVWKLPLTVIILKKVKEAGFKLHSSLETWLEEQSYHPERHLYKLDEAFDQLPLQLHDYQKDGIKFVIQKEGRALIGDEMGLGKAMPLYVDIITPSGKIKMKDIAIGDIVAGSDGLSYTIEGVFPQGILPVWDITFSDGTITSCCDEHLWNISIDGNAYQTLPFAIIRSFYRYSSFRYKITIPLTAPIEAPMYKRTSSFYDIGKNVINNKYITIPDDYRYESASQREQLLQGMLDTIPHHMLHIQSTGIYINQLPMHQAVELQEQVERLGGTVYIEHLSQSLCVRVPASISPFTDPDRVKQYNTIEQRKLPERYIIDISYAGEQECQCIKTSAPDSLYLTDHCIVTHNTAQATVYCSVVDSVKQCLVICPASLKLNWAKEIKMWMPHNSKVYVIDGLPKDGKQSLLLDPAFLVADSKNPDAKIIVIINYDIVANRTTKEKDEMTEEMRTVSIAYSGWLTIIKRQPFDLCIIDESQYISNPNAFRTKAVKAIAGSIKQLIALSGTPIRKKPMEFYNIIHLIKPGLVGGYFEYGKRYCAGKFNGYGWDFTGASNTEELFQILRNIMIRRKKSEVMTLGKQHSIVPLPLDKKIMKEYYIADDDIIHYAKTRKSIEDAENAAKAEGLYKVNTLTRIATEAKLAACLEWIETFLQSEEKLVVIATNTFVVKAVMDKFKHISTKNGIAVELTGSTSSVDRQKAVDAFQTSEKCRLFVGNIQAAGVGITLTAASNLAILQLPWTPDALQQVEDRIHRIGQKEESVTIWYLIAAGTIEEDVAQLLDERRKVLDAVVDGQQTEVTSLLSELLVRYQKRKEQGKK